MDKWSFCDENDKLIDLVIKGIKTGTTSKYNPNELPVIGEQSKIVYDSGKDTCIIETEDYKILRFCEVDNSLSDLEGEGSFES